RSTRGVQSGPGPAIERPASACPTPRRRAGQPPHRALRVPPASPAAARRASRPRRTVCPRLPQGAQWTAMSEELRLLAGEPVRTLDDWISRGGGRGLDAARDMGPEAVLAEVDASGL